MQIVLVRHGKPDIDIKDIRAAQLADWVQQYNSADLLPGSTPPTALLDLAQHGVILCSDLKRSQQSAQRILEQHRGIEQRLTGHSIYREIDLPKLHFPSPNFSPATWVVVFRLLWLLGLSRQCESFFAAKKRAQFAGRQLELAAQQHGSVMLVGHGLFNRFIAKALRQRNWLGPTHTGSLHWDYAVFKKGGAA